MLLDMFGRRDAALRSFVVVFFFASLACCLTPEAQARGIFRRSRGTSSYSSVPSGHSNETAQAVAEANASMGRLAHLGGISKSGGQYEGLSVVSYNPKDHEGSLRRARASTCYANAGLRECDIGYCIRNGRVYCCRRFIR